MRRSFLSLLLLALVAALISHSSPAGGVAGFGDVESERYYTEPVQWMVDNGITTGTSPTCFSPDDPVTRGQAAAFLWRVEGFPEGSPPHTFTDVVADWQQEPVSWMAFEGITNGTSPTTYSPDDTLTRGQMAALLHRTAGSPAAAPTTFPDVSKHWQLVPVGWMEAEEITTGTSPTTFDPEDAVTRGQFATFAWRWKDSPGVVVDPYSPPCPDGSEASPTAIVAMGDSYISGEAGRWAGNSTNPIGDSDGTDRAYRGPLDYDVDSIYLDGTNASGCHRADAAPIQQVSLDVDRRINIACSGARTTHVRSSASGGVAFRGEPPQVDQLATVSASHDVELVIVSMGGNDLGFGDLVTDCALGYVTSVPLLPNRCADEKQADVDSAMQPAMAGVVDALLDARRVLDANGDRDARIVLASYPSPIPHGDELRYSSYFDRVFVGGCPFWRSDASWARSSLVPQIASGLRGAAAAAGVEFLDLQDLFEGREVCAESSRHSDGNPASIEDEWVRFIIPGDVRGETQESLHPNFFGQQAIGRCIELVALSQPGGEWRCANRSGEDARSVDLTPL